MTGKAKAAGKAKATAKAKAKATSKGVAKAQAKVLAKAQAKGMAKSQAKGEASAQPKPGVCSADTSKAGRGDAKGWADITPGATSLGKLGAMAVADHLKSLAKKGNTGPLDHYKTLKGQEKIEFALQLKVDRTAAFFTCKESHKLETLKENTLVTGWLTDFQIAKEEGIQNFKEDGLQKQVLEAILADLPSRPHEKPSLAAMGIKQYDYSAKKLMEIKQRQVDSMECEAKADMQAPEYDEALGMIQNVDNVMGSQTSKRTKPNTPKPPTTLSPEEIAKQDWIKEVKILQNTCTRDMNALTHLKIKGHKMISDKQSGVTKELLGALENGIKSLHDQGEVLYEILIDGTSKPADTLDITKYSKKMEQAKNLLSSLAEIKTKGNRIIGK